MKLLVGLGNPGKKYDGTRHNVGFEVLTEMAHRHGASRPKTKFEAELAEVMVAGERLLLVAPQTFMNLSGRSVRQVLDFFQLTPADVLVTCDDINLPLGRLRLRKSGSAGGQKGLANILQHLGTEDVPRLRIGVDTPPGGRDAADYVLDRFSKAERAIMDKAVLLAADAVETWLELGISAAMNRYNAPNDKPEQGEKPPDK
ncbi:MAG TPA: aminoacyl-tRNA hydrolase [Planctomycetaceae bacterium]|nr:aminoacyl-tRNA hydrolase [Planctomycetaceae bacterium]